MESKVDSIVKKFIDWCKTDDAKWEFVPWMTFINVIIFICLAFFVFKLGFDIPSKPDAETSNSITVLKTFKLLLSAIGTEMMLRALPFYILKKIFNLKEKEAMLYLILVSVAVLYLLYQKQIIVLLLLPTQILYMITFLKMGLWDGFNLQKPIRGFLYAVSVNFFSMVIIFCL